MTCTHVTEKTEFLRYMVFAFSDYYPSGGLFDVVASFDTIDDFRAEKDQIVPGNDYVQLFDRVEGTFVQLESL